MRGVRLCTVPGYEACLVRYWLDPDGTLWSGPSIKRWWTTASGVDVHYLSTEFGKRAVSVRKLLRDAFGASESSYVGDPKRNPLRVAAITPEGDAVVFDSAGEAGRKLNYQAGDVARTARHNTQILNGEKTFSYKGIRRLRGHRLFLLDTLNTQHKTHFYEILRT